MPYWKVILLKLRKKTQLCLVSYSVVPNSDKNAIKILKNLQKNGFKINTGVSNKEQFNKFINLGFKKANKIVPDLEALLILENENIPLGKKIGYTAFGLGGGMLAGGYLGNVAGGFVDGMDIALEHPNYSRDQIESEIKRRVSNGDAYLLDGLQYGVTSGGIIGGLYGFNKANQKKTIGKNNENRN